jgi:ABC-type sulfate/molybdate transport systems ATPase subunit
LLRAIAHLTPWSGTVLLDGEPATTPQVRQAVAAVLQRPVLQRTTVLDNAAAGLRLRGVRRGEARRRAEPWLDALGVAHLATRHARTLSGGEAQRVAIARALAVAPRVLLLDEPFTGLDATTRTDLLADLRAALERQNAAVLLVTHDRDEARALAHRTALLVNGEIRQLGDTAAVLDAPKDLECASLLGFTTHLPPALTGRPATLVVRPERCYPLTGTAPPGTLVIEGVLRRVVPLGGAVRLDVDTPAGPITALTTTEVPTTPGNPIRVAVAAEHLRAITRVDG